jgi:ABC-type Fe3+ transport system substrate-binding protein
MMFPEITTGPMNVMGINAKAKAPNAARLLVAYLMSEEGSKVFYKATNNEPTPFSGTLPKGFIDPTIAAADAKTNGDAMQAALHAGQ